MTVVLGVADRHVVRAEERADGWNVECVLDGQDVRCLASDPLQPEVAYAGTQGEGLFRSHDCGRTWMRVGRRDVVVKAIAPSPHTPGLVWIGTKTAAVIAAHDHGERWTKLAPFPKWRSWFWLTPAERPLTQPYVLALAESPAQPGLLLAGIEAGALVMSEDGGRTWSGHRRGASRDCHSLTFSADGTRAYEAGGTGAAMSRDGGRSWAKHLEGLDRRYCWSVAADPHRPETWYVGAAPGAHEAHGRGPAEAAIFRSDGDGWTRLTGGLPDPLPAMPYGLAAGSAGEVWCALADGAVWRSGDYGASWARVMELPPLRPGFSVLPAE